MNNMMRAKKEYRRATMDIVFLQTEDVLTQSGNDPWKDDGYNDDWNSVLD